MKKHNYLLFAFAVFAFLSVSAAFPQTDFSMSSFLDVFKPDPFSQLWEKIYQFSKENNETRRWLVDDKTKYFAKTPKEEWLPLLEKFLIQDDLSETVEHWLRFSNTYMSSITNESVRLELKEKLKAGCEKEGHYSFEKFTSALVNAEVNEKCLLPNSSAKFLSDSSDADEVRYSITFYNLADSLVYLDLTNELPKVAERLMRSLDMTKFGKVELERNDILVHDDCRWQPSLYRVKEHDINVERAHAFCQEYNCISVFSEYLDSKYPESPLLMKLCLTDVRGENASFAHLQKYLPPEKIYEMKGDPDGLLFCLDFFRNAARSSVRESFPEELAKYPDTKEFLRKYVQIKIEEDCERFLREAWFWSNFDRNNSKRSIGLEVIKPYLAALPKQDMLTLRRLGQVSETNWFKAFVNEGWEKERSVPFAVEKALLTEDSEEFAELLSFIAKADQIMIGDIPFFVRKLNDETPESCADDILRLCNYHSAVFTEYSARLTMEKFIKWCEKKGRNDVAETVKTKLPKR